MRRCRRASAPAADATAHDTLAPGRGGHRAVLRRRPTVACGAARTSLNFPAARCVACLLLRTMSEQTAAETELAELLVESLNIEGMAPAEIDPQAPLFGDGLGLDSIDALELALAISKKYGFQLRADSDENKRIFANLRSLAGYVEQHRAS